MKPFRISHQNWAESSWKRCTLPHPWGIPPFLNYGRTLKKLWPINQGPHTGVSLPFKRQSFKRVCEPKSKAGSSPQKKRHHPVSIYNKKKRSFELILLELRPSNLPSQSELPSLPDATQVRSDLDIANSFVLWTHVASELIAHIGRYGIIEFRCLHFSMFI